MVNVVNYKCSECGGSMSLVMGESLARVKCDVCGFSGWLVLAYDKVETKIDIRNFFGQCMGKYLPSSGDKPAKWEEPV